MSAINVYCLRRTTSGAMIRRERGVNEREKQRHTHKYIQRDHKRTKPHRTKRDRDLDIQVFLNFQIFGNHYRLVIALLNRNQIFRHDLMWCVSCVCMCVCVCMYVCVCVCVRVFSHLNSSNHQQQTHGYPRRPKGYFLV